MKPDKHFTFFSRKTHFINIKCIFENVKLSYRKINFS